MSNARTSIAAIPIGRSKVGKSTASPRKWERVRQRNFYLCRHSTRRERAENAVHSCDPRHYARDIICDCIATRQSSARQPLRASIRICECVEPWSLTTRREGRAILNSNANLRERSGRSFSSAMPRWLIVVMFCGTYIRYLRSLDVKQVSAVLYRASGEIYSMLGENHSVKCIYVGVCLAATSPRTGFTTRFSHELEDFGLNAKEKHVNLRGSRNGITNEARVVITEERSIIVAEKLEGGYPPCSKESPVVLRSPVKLILPGWISI